MSGVSDAIETANAAAGADAVRTSMLSDVANWGGLALTLLLAGGLLVFCERFMSKPLTQMTNGLIAAARNAVIAGAAPGLGRATTCSGEG